MRTMDRQDQIEASSIADDPPSICEAKKRVIALGLTGPRTCGRCRQLRKGRIIYGYTIYGNTEYFVCFNCLVKAEAKEISETDEFMRKDRVWKMRRAREIWMNRGTVVKRIDPRYLADELPYQPAGSEMPLMQVEPSLTQEEKEDLVRKLMNTIDLPVNSSETGL